jgi:hypothetical protein
MPRGISKSKSPRQYNFDVEVRKGKGPNDRFTSYSHFGAVNLYFDAHKPAVGTVLRVFREDPHMIGDRDVPFETNLFKVTDHGVQPIENVDD